MAEYVCESCGQRNPAGTEFCVYCRAYLAWEATGELSLATAGRAGPVTTAEAVPEEETPTVLRPPPSAAELAAAQVAATTAEPTPETGAEVPAEGPDPTDGRLRVTAESGQVTTPTTGEPATLVLRATNTSDIVDGYVVEAPDAPHWLVVTAPQLRLYPGTEETVTVSVQIASPTPVTAQQLTVALRVRSLGFAQAHQDVPVLVTVPVLDIPVLVSAEPRLLRVRDRGAAEFSLVVNNSRSNHPVQVRLAGTDPELAVRFRFDPPVLAVGPAASERARVLVTMPEPEAGQELTRSLTVTAVDGDRTAETTVTLHQATTARTADPPVTLELEPSLVRAPDATIALARLTVDNRRGRQWVQLKLSAVDPERIVRVDFAHPELRVPPGGTAQTEFRLQAPLPEAGSEVSRAVTLRASDGHRESTTTATFVQTASVSPMRTLAVRLEPAVVRVRDADTAAVQVVLDNRQGRSGVRLRLDGRDPERAVRFSFYPPVVDVGPGQVQAVTLQLDAYRPEPNTEISRQLTVTATDGRDTVEGSGSWAHASSRSAMELLTVRLDPSIVRLPNRRRGSLAAIVDNTQGSQPIRVTMHGDDPENVVGFTFNPAVLDVAPGQFGRSLVAVRVPRAPVGPEVTRPFLIAASDGRSAAQTEGSLIQSTAERRGLARVLLTLFGALLMILGTFRSWIGGRDFRGVDIDLDFAEQLFRRNLTLGSQQLEQLLSVGLAILVLAVLAVFGLTGRSGRLTRWSAFLAVALLVAFFIVLTVRVTGLLPGPGAFLILLGCVLAYVGGLLTRKT